jgi:Schlafen, AlbA_2
VVPIVIKAVGVGVASIDDIRQKGLGSYRRFSKRHLLIAFCSFNCFANKVFPMADDFLNLTEYSHIKKLVADGIEEGLTLDYKASPALARDDKQINEMCKDVSAFANSAGGQLIYGVVEDKVTRKPTATDPGVTDAKITREWIEQVLNSRIQPRISNIRTAQLDNRKGGSVFVVTVPSSQTGPHQAPDKRYYKRFDLRSVAMEDYEIKDVMRRATTPNLQIRLAFKELKTTVKIEFDRGEETSRPIELRPMARNLSGQPAEYAMVDIGIDLGLKILRFGDYNTIGNRDDGRGIQLQWVRFAYQPPRMPIFKEFSPGLATIPLELGFPSHLLAGEKLFDFAVIVATPGFQERTYWTAHSRASSLTFYPPEHQFTRTRI